MAVTLTWDGCAPALLTALASAAVFAGAAPSARQLCSTTSATMDLPANQTTLVAPTTAPLFVAFGVGIQNYNCSSTTLTYTSIGAVASIFDILCLDSTSFADVQTSAFNIWSAAPDTVTANSIYHYFVIDSAGVLSPEWDFTTTGRGYVIATKVDTLAAVNVAWLELDAIPGDGTLAPEIFRIDTVNGQPPTSCVAGSADISVKYTAKYYLY
ncbi:hypothetical protein B0H11DRAFT_2228796 [Mycena galericulata]|nr:hypothetical protein B0H11DRAFT_2228796 [Mycena galericulata]